MRFQPSLCLKLCLYLAIMGAGSHILFAAEELNLTAEDLAAQQLPLEKIQAHVKHLSSLGSRVAGSAGHEAAREYIVKTIADLGYHDSTGPGSYNSDDLLKAIPLTEAAKSESGQTVTTFAEPTRKPFNIRFRISDPDNTLLGGKAVVKGKGLAGEDIEEKITFPKAKLGYIERTSDKPLTALTSLTILEVTGEMDGQEKLQVGMGTRYSIGSQRFWGVAPYDIGSGKLRIDPPADGADEDLLYEIHPAWPNGPAITSTGPAGVTGPIIYAGTGKPGAYSGLPVQDAIVLLDIDVDTDWTTAPGLGAKAVIFIEPKQALRPLLERLTLLTPVEFPRMWIDREKGEALKARLQKVQAAGKTLSGNAQIGMQWREQVWQNVYLLIPGSKKFGPYLNDLSEDQLKETKKDAEESTIILSAYYDSNSIIPAKAPGAEQALSCATLLELARRFTEQPPARDVLLVFCAGHFQGLKGEREFFAGISMAEELDKVESNHLFKRAVPDSELSTIRGRGVIYEHMAQNLPETAECFDKAKLQALAEAACAQYAESKAAEIDRQQMEATRETVNWLWTGIGLFCWILAFACYRAGWEYRAPIMTALIFLGIGMVLYKFVKPQLKPVFKADIQIASPTQRMDGLLDMWKQECVMLESEMEREARLLRYDGLRNTPEFENLAKQREAYSSASRVLYSISSAGSPSNMPDNPEQYLPQILEGQRRMKARVKREMAWVREEMARRKANRPFLDLCAARLARISERKSLFLSLDLSAGNPGIGQFYLGYFYGKYGDIESRFKNFGRNVAMPIAKAVEKAAGTPKEGDLIPDTFVGKRNWQTFMATDLALASEIAVQAQMRGLTFATIYDRRMYWDSPQDTYESITNREWKFVDRQTALASLLIHEMLKEPRLTEESRFDKGLKHTGYSQQIFKAVRRGGSRSIFPNIPVMDTMIMTPVNNAHASGVRLALTEKTNALGVTRMVGLRRGGAVFAEAIVCDRETGEVNYALNKGKHKINPNDSYRNNVSSATKKNTLELFRAQGLAMMNIIDPGRLTPLRNCAVLAGQTESQPQEFGTSHKYWQEPHRVLYAEPRSRIKCIFREGEFGVRVAILDVEERIRERLHNRDLPLEKGESKEITLNQARGQGFKLGDSKVLSWLPLATADDLWCLAEKRLESLREHSITNAKLDNPEFPGPFSKGRVTVANEGKEVIGTGVEWNRAVIGLPFEVEGTGEKYRVEEFVEPNKLILERPYLNPSAKDVSFILTKEKAGLHNLSKMRLAESRAAIKSRQYGEAWRLATEAWGLESRAYPEVLGTANDSVMGVVFYLFLLLPFCFFIERLLFAFPRIEHQISAFFIIFVLMFVLLWLVHPAFELVAAPPVILLAFVIMSLSGIVIAIVYGKFNTEMRLIQQGIQGTISADVNRASAAMVAVSLGISQMRRRKVRTALTCVTIVLLTFTALSFTSTVQTISQAHTDLSPGDEQDSPYNGILLRQLNFDTLSIDVYEQLQQELMTVGLKAAPRFWKVANKGEVMIIDVIADASGAKTGPQNTRRASPSAMLGLSAEEARIYTKLGQPTDKGGVLEAGRWMDESDFNTVLIPSTLVEQLKPADHPEDQAWGPKDVLDLQLRLGSYPVKVVGVFSPDELSALKDIDDEMITPADFAASEASRGAEQKNDQTADVEDLESAKAARFEHVSAGDTIIVPWRLAKLMGADLRSVASRIEQKDHPDNPGILDYVIKRVLLRLEKNLFVGKDNRRQLYASTGKMSLAGLGNLVVPLLISVLILLNTMIGAVYERGREITIFSALGLAPSHVAALFLAESIVYATLGAILGYLMGQGVAKVIQFVEVSGLYLNYSSSSAVFVTAVVMFSVIGSTLYPAAKAAKAASPSEDRRWGVPAPVGDEISLELPFSFQHEIVAGSALFLHEYFESHAESSLGKFTAKEVTLEAFHTENGPGVCLFFMAWLTPYDLGVSQEVQLYIIPSEDKDLYITEATFYRVSGYVNSWRRVNLPFLNALRKHLLIWRTYSPEQRIDYATRGYYLFEQAFSAVGWPKPQGPRPEEMPEPEMDEGEDEEDATADAAGATDAENAEEQAKTADSGDAQA